MHTVPGLIHSLSPQEQPSYEVFIILILHLSVRLSVHVYERKVTKENQPPHKKLCFSPKLKSTVTTSRALLTRPATALVPD